MLTPQQQNYIDRLREFPANFEALVGALSDEELERREAPGEWSVRQIVNHVADSHMNAMARLKLPLTEDNPTIRTYIQDKWAELPDYALPVESALLILKGLHIHFVALLSALTEEQWKRPLRHPEAGDQVLEDIAATYAWHGENHIEQIKRALAAGLRK
jgi:uncharacterized damage-inducible protein DinB